MNNPGFRYNRLENYLVLHKTRDRSFLIEDGYRYLWVLRKMLATQMNVDLALTQQTPEDRHKFLQFTAFLKQIGFLASELEESDSLNQLPIQPPAPNIQLNDALFDAMSDRISKENIPENLYIEVTEPAIGVTDASREPTRTLSGKKFDQLFLQFEALGGKRVVFAGTEPFGWSRFPGILSKTANYGFGIEIVTDASRLTPKIVALLNNLKIDNLMISLNEHNAKQKPAHEGEALLRKAKMAMLLLKQNGIRYTVVCPVTNNIRNSISFFSLLAARNQNQIFADPSPPSMDQKLTQSEHAHNCSNQEGFHFTDPQQKVSVYSHENSRMGTKRTIHVLTTGEVFLGCNRAFSLGNLHGKSLLDICTEKISIS